MPIVKFRYYINVTAELEFIIGFPASVCNWNKPMVDIMDPISAIATDAQTIP